MSTHSAPKSVATPISVAEVASMSAESIRFKKWRFSDLPWSVLEQWRIWQKQSDFYSPYFHPEFSACVNRVRDDVEVATAHSNQELVAVLPFQFDSGNVAEPVGGAVNDYHGVISAANRSVSAIELLRGVGLNRFKFHSWLQHDQRIEESSYEKVLATVADISMGFEPFHNELCSKSSTIKRHPQKTRKLMREVGPLRLELNCQDPKVLAWVIQKKREKYQRSGVVDFFGVEWTRNLMQEIHKMNNDQFGGMLSALYAGDKLVAAHFGMRSYETLHYWYPVYDLSYRNYSPGTQLFLEIAKEAESNGISQIDFGYGDDPYKDKLTNRRFHVFRGCVDFNRFRSTCNKQVDQIVSRVKSSPAKQPLKRIIRLFMPNAGQPRV